MTTVQVPYSNAGAAAFEGLDTWQQGMLLNGDHPALSTARPFLVKANEVLARFAVVGFQAGKLVAADYIGAQAGDDQDIARGNMIFTTPPDADDTITIGSTVYTWKATPGATAGAVKTGASNTLAGDALVAAINAEGSAALFGTETVAHPDVYAVKVDADNVALYAKISGAAGNLIATTQTGDESAFGAATLEGGEGLGVNPIGVLAYAVTGNAQGTSVGLVFYSGHFNQDFLVWGASFDTDAKKQAAFEGAPTPVTIRVTKRG